MKLFALLHDSDDNLTANRVFGVVVGIVTNNQDPDGMGRVKVKYPWISDNDESYWARISSLMAGNGRGAYFLPELDDEVLVAFEHGDLRFPYVLGALWNGKDKMPESNSNGENNIRVIKSRSGHVLRFNDKSGSETIEIIDKNNNSIILDTAKNSITIKSKKDITLSASQGTITLDAQKIEIKSSGQTTIQAQATLDLKATAMMNIKGAVVNIN